MPLPELPITTPEQTSYRTAIEAETLPAMLEALHAGVLELGVGRCKVRVNDESNKRTIGLVLSTDRGGFTREWSFFIRLTRLKNLAPEHLRELVRTPRGRGLIAEVIERGEPLSALEGVEAPAFPG